MTTLLRFTLDLFGFEPAAPVQRRKPARPPVLKQKEAPAQTDPAPSAIKSIADQSAPADALPPQTLQQSLTPTTLRHPRASRQTLLGDVVVAYEFTRGKRRTIGFSVGPDGLAVRAPQWVPLPDIDKAVLEKSDWILKKLQEMRERGRQLEASRIEWADGCVLLFLGRQVTVRLDPRHAFSGVGAELQSVELPDSPIAWTLHVGLPHSAAPAQIRDAVQAWLMRQAKRLFTERLDHFAPQVSVQWRKLSLSSAGTRWGSASADGSIRLNWRLIHFRQAVIDYVVVHELSHLRVMDHSPRFWDTVRAVVPDYAQLRGQLKDEAIPKW
ncbi:MAG: metal-dependent hydrolase [Polaromonas sp. 39-63-203]|jgi:predicted metal-dependent hydrolase|uniref:M48 family metallopeptidase n=1 Tax=Polaromonas sp. TaxID=1869339 RepID=UPI000BC55A0B|nr:SprT family zinc-dependent metalloprotease [Polaromonas sp.]OYY51586.1 MAG: metal-dependent hydrolase [Polaromonas sp. 35-63-240]OYZ83077.1 MAG: metal-dependent hydrolase [Polaromonas sp. 24-62-144]OZA96423.1 MAG: metal-dependent hydrolase [Polaromonas sp. 39-63-203]HQS32054.1 SprT family zinc-dependent metalloprotease [Polaromonas sp.]HQS91330.1 SprT family zinc-dependent metalloprotease [Polaromonas sp.]